jgi:hypothetical protein
MQNQGGLDVETREILPGVICEIYNPPLEDAGGRHQVFLKPKLNVLIIDREKRFWLALINKFGETDCLSNMLFTPESMFCAQNLDQARKIISKKNINIIVAGQAEDASDLKLLSALTREKMPCVRTWIILDSEPHWGKCAHVFKNYSNIADYMARPEPIANDIWRYFVESFIDSFILAWRKIRDSALCEYHKNHAGII